MDRDPFDFTPDPPATEDEVERPEAGEDDPALMAPVLAALKTVQDPEIPVNLVELGLIYELIVKKGGTVYVEMTLTTPSCPVAAAMPGEVETAIRASRGLRRAGQARLDAPLDPGPEEGRSKARARAIVGFSKRRAVVVERNQTLI
jgi:metal-sulfur cluster biosynthetic enzyme